MDAGADGIALISGILGAKDIKEKTGEFLDCMKKIYRILLFGYAEIFFERIPLAPHPNTLEIGNLKKKKF